VPSGRHPPIRGTLGPVRIFSRYIFRECLIYFGISLVAFTGILLTLRMLKFASLIINKGVELEQIGRVFISIVPTFLEIALPLAVLLGVMLAFARLSGDSEVIVLRASGISITQLVRPVMLFGCVLAAVNLLISMELRPWGFRELADSLFQIARTRSTAGLTEGVFNNLGQITLYSEKIDFQSGALTNVLIDDRRAGGGRKIVTARRGAILSSEAQKEIVLHLEEGVIHEQIEGRYSITRFDRNRLTINPDELYGEEAATKERRPNELYIPELRTTRAVLEASLEAGVVPADVAGVTNLGELERKINRLKLEEGRRFSMPYASFILALLGMSLGIQPPRSQKAWGAGLSATLGLLVFVLYYGLLSTGITLGENGRLNPHAALWLPNIVATGVAMFVLHRLGTERWHSILHGFEGGFRALSRRFGRIQPKVAA